MADLIHEFTDLVHDGDGDTFRAQAWGEQRPDGTWQGWLEFVSLDAAINRQTTREITQSTRDALVYWASGLEPIYLEGAFHRAVRSGVGLCL